MRRRKTSLISIREVCDINMTPMMDLTFILLITFIITFPMIEKGISVELPKGKSGAMTSKDKARSVTIDVNGNLFLDDRPVSKNELVQAMGDNPPELVYVRADLTVNYGRVAEVAGLLQEAKVKTMSLVTAGE
jgi:biopolymer transport protein ExbD